MGFVPFSPPTLSWSINRANSNSLCPYPAHLDLLPNRARLFDLIHAMYFCRVELNLTIFLCSAYTGATNELTVATSVAINWIQFDTAEMRVMNRIFNRIVIAKKLFLTDRDEISIAPEVHWRTLLTSQKKRICEVLTEKEYLYINIVSLQ